MKPLSDDYPLVRAGEDHRKLRETSKPTTGVRNPDRPSHWLVSPWPADAGVCDVVSHFLRSSPRSDDSTAQHLAYAKGYYAAITTAPTHELVHPRDLHWYEDICECARRCIVNYQKLLQAEGRTAQATMWQLRAGAAPLTTAPFTQS